MSGAITVASFSETIKLQIGNFLYTEGISTTPFLLDGIFNIVNLISDYQEEGKILFPEVFITTDLNVLDTFPHNKIKIGETVSSEDGYKKILKECAPLCNSEWIIYIEAKGGNLTYGIIYTELIETSPSLYEQTVGKMKMPEEYYSVAYIRNIGKKTVEIRGLKTGLIVSLSLNDSTALAVDETSWLAEEITSKLDEDIQLIARQYYSKIIGEAFKEGHGNLLGVIEEEDSSITNLKSELNDGIYLDSPINIIDFLRAFESDKTASNSVALRQYANIIKSMCNNDGMTIFTNTGKLLAYKVIVNKNYLTEEIRKDINGGSRTRAFFNIKHCGLFVSGLIKSQDGPVKTFKNE